MPILAYGPAVQCGQSLGGIVSRGSMPAARGAAGGTFAKVVAAALAAAGASLAAGVPAGATTVGARHAPVDAITSGHPYRHGAVPTRAFLNAHPTFNSTATSANDLNYGGGTTAGGETVGVTTGREQVYLVFWGSQWGTQGTDSSGYFTYSGDPKSVAPDLQAFFKGLGTGGETWSGVMTQYCEGVAFGDQTCGSSDPHVGYPTGGALAGVWEDTSTAEPATASGHEIGQEAVNAATHFGNTTTASNRDAQYVIVSPTGTNPDNYKTGGFCAWHDWNGDTTLSGGAVTSPDGPLAFTNLPYIPDAGSACGQGFVNTPGTLDGVTIVEGHEYAETVTDQFPAGGWTDSSGAENGDKCAWISSGQGASQDITLTTGTFAVQSTWANDAGGGTGGCEVFHPIVGSSGAPGAPGTPDAVAGPTGVAGHGEAVLSFAPAVQNASSVTGYTVAPSPPCACGGLTPASNGTTVTGLTPGVAYTFTVTATNADGTGPASGISSSLTVTTVPGAPRAVAAVLTPAGTVRLTWAAPATPSGLPVVRYAIAVFPACGSCRIAASGTAASVTGLPKGERAVFTVRAVNRDGTGQAASSGAVVGGFGAGYWLATAGGRVFALGDAASLGGITTSAGAPVVGIVATPDAEGYLVVTAYGRVAAFGDATFHGDLPGQGVVARDIVAVAPTADGRGYWLVGSDGGLFAFGDARYHGSLPAQGTHVSDIVGMVATPSGTGYLLIGADGGVFAFGSARFFGSLPGRGVRVSDIGGILPSATGNGYVLVGADGGAFVFGSGVRYFGSLPSRGVAVHDIVGLALTPDDGGYLMAGSDGTVYGFGDATVFPRPSGLGGAGLVAAIAGV